MVYAALDKTLANLGRKTDAFVAKIVPKGKFDLRIFEENFVMLRWDEYLTEKAKEEEMIGWYHSAVNTNRKNMEKLRSAYEGKIVLYKRIFRGNQTPYVIYDNGKEINVTEETLADIEFENCARQTRLAMLRQTTA